MRGFDSKNPAHLIGALVIMVVLVFVAKLIFSVVATILGALFWLGVAVVFLGGIGFVLLRRGRSN